MNFLFPKKLRLLTSGHFNFVFQQSQRINIINVTILSRFNTLNYPRIGFIITKKNIKYAHDRNRIKRLIRESFRLNRRSLPAIDFIFIVKKGAANLSNRKFIEMLKKLWRCYYHHSHNC